ncbi:LysR family transcriptional regulator [Pseudomonas moraviensis]|uniref:LysR family transcriptional regulator n=1 Tax=Pseudomonas moraviensis TaxID=321662 RepID=UPI00135DE307|nr:LysR family transcriptional regulator [Pseudomonas moraviensis]MXI47088.1 LysR family transcriptional regulator [Pseudomonas moraviensis]
MAERIEEMRALVAVVSTGGFAAGAKQLGVVKSAVSRRIRDLEDRLGARLFDRTTRCVQLTEVGREFHDRAVELLAGLQEAEEAASSSSCDLKGCIRIAAPVSFTTRCLVPALGRFLERHPAVSLSIDTDDRTVDVIRNGYDLAIRIACLPDSSLVARRLVTIRHVCVVSPALLKKLGTPLTPDDLSRFPGVVYSNVDTARYWKFVGNVPSVTCKLDFANGDAIREAVIAGLGVAVLPTFIVHDAVRRGDLSIVLAQYMRPPIAMYAVHPSMRYQTARARALINFLVDAFGGDPEWDQGLFKDLALGPIQTPRMASACSAPPLD